MDFCKSTGGSSSCPRVPNADELVVAMGDPGHLKGMVGFSNNSGVLAMTVVSVVPLG